MSSIYAVRKGRQIGLFRTWEEIEPLVKGYSGASYRSFRSIDEANAYLTGDATSNSLLSLIKPITDNTKLKGSATLITTQSNKPEVKPTSDIRIFLKLKKTPDPCLQSKLPIQQTVPSLPVSSNRRNDLNVVRKVSLSPASNLIPNGVENLNINHMQSQVHNGEIKSTLPELIRPAKKDKLKLSIYCDGSCFGNGKKFAIGGIGIYFANPDYHRYNVSEPFTLEPTATNNKTEIYALKRSLDIICSLIDGNKETNYEFEVCTDSQYTIKCLTEWLPGWMRNQWVKRDGQPVQNVELLKSLSASYNKCRRQTQIKYTKGHSGAKDGNYYADQLAVEGSKKHVKYRKPSESKSDSASKFPYRGRR
jgi:ribonuclease HI